MLIEHIAGKPFGEFLNERIFQPLGMANTKVTDLHAITTNRAQSYVLEGKNLRIGPFVSPTWPFSAGCLSSTAGDLLKWDQALSAGKLLDKSAQNLMWTPTEQSLAAGSGYGYGWNVRTLYGHRVISHGGMIPGFYAEFSRFVDDKLTIVLLMNATGGLINPRKLLTGIAGQFLPELIPKQPEPAADPDPELTKRLADVVARAMSGELVAEAFETKLQPELASLFRKAADFDSLFGRLQTLQLLKRKAFDAGLHLQYRAIFENDTARVYLDLDKEGKISRWGLGSDN
jgi:CubicO group peptidase (beta-lactamase class C family)